MSLINYTQGSPREPHRREVFHFCMRGGADVFQKWIDGLSDVTGRAAILKRIDRVEEGLLGDHLYVGRGVWELRIHSGPGYRVYFGLEGRDRILLLLGGGKRSQTRDIGQAQMYWQDYRRKP
jgi:putative addiction module killer protein